MIYEGKKVTDVREEGMHYIHSYVKENGERVYELHFDETVVIMAEKHINSLKEE